MSQKQPRPEADWHLLIAAELPAEGPAWVPAVAGLGAVVIPTHQVISLSCCLLVEVLREILPEKFPQANLPGRLHIVQSASIH